MSAVMFIEVASRTASDAITDSDDDLHTTWLYSPTLARCRTSAARTPAFQGTRSRGRLVLPFTRLTPSPQLGRSDQLA